MQKPLLFDVEFAVVCSLSRVAVGVEVSGYVRGCSRGQVRLSSLDGEVAADSVARAVDAFVAAADLRELGFLRAADVGRPRFEPGAMAKLLLYGYLEGMRSSRKLAKECRRNAEARWLMRDARPCFKTIANFRRDNHAAQVSLNSVFARFCREVELFGADVVAVDGSKFQAAAGPHAVYNKARLESELAAVSRRAEGRMAAYLEAVEAADAVDEAAGSSDASAKRAAAVEAVLAKLAAREDKLQAMTDGLSRSGATHCVEGDDARLLHKVDGGRVVGYNVQTAVDAKHKLIAHVEVTTDANDHGRLYKQAEAAKEMLGVEKLTVLADAGYKNAEQTQACEDAGIEVVTPASRVVNPHGGAYFSRDRFEYDAGRDQYTCPGGETLTLRGVDGKARVYQASASACVRCVLRSRCTKGKRRTVKRHICADAQEAANKRAAENPALMRMRRKVAEHPFANLKRSLGNGRFLMRGLKHVQAEMSLSVLAYNLRRASNIVGVERLCVMLAAGPMPYPPAAPRTAPP